MTYPNRLVNTDKLKQEIADKLPISEVAERLCDVELVNAGHQKKGLCPLHGEDTPSFYVNDTKGFFNCFGCKTGGDTIQLVREFHHVGYHDALAILAEGAGIDIAEYQRPATPEEKEQDRLREWVRGYLEGLDYDESRVSAPVAMQFDTRIPTTARGPYPASLKEKPYLFKGSVLFPYRTHTGQVVGWKVRHKDGKQFMTPNDFPLTETVIYGLNVTRPFIELGKLTLVEGEYDTEVLFDHGIQNVAGIGGSRWTDEHMQILEDLSIREVTFFLDGDEGGRTAAEAIAKRYWRHPKLRVKLVLAMGGADPEDMVRAMGADLVQAHIDGAKDALEWLLWEEWASAPRQSLSQKMDYVKWVQSEYGEQLAGVQETLVLREVAKWLDLPEANVLDFVRANKTLLQAPESEKIVMGRCLRDQRYYIELRKRIVRTDFFVLKHQRIWQVLEDILGDGLDWDPATIRKRGEGQGVEPAYVDILMETGDLNIGWHEDQVLDFSIRRTARADADYFREVIGDLNVPANQVIGTLTHAVTSKALGRASGAFRGITEQVDEAVESLHQRMKNPDEVVGIDLGSQFPTITRSLQGLQPRRLVMVAATSGRGKSTMTLQWCVSMAVHQAIPVDFISLEMDSDEILFKAASHMTGIDSMRISGGAVTPEELPRVEQAMQRIRQSPLRIYAPDGITPNEFLLYAREAHMERRTEVFVIDYAQMVGPDPETQRLSRYEQLGQFAYLCKQKIARGLDTTVIAVAQLKREAAGKEEPTPEDIGDSYELVRACDVVILINENDNQQTETWIGKNRQGPGQVLVPTNYDKPMNTFHEISGGAKEPDYRLIHRG